MPPAWACSAHAPRTLAPRRRSSVTDGVLPNEVVMFRLALSRNRACNQGTEALETPTAQRFAWQGLPP